MELKKLLISRWRDILLIVVFILIFITVITFQKNVRIIKENPCRLCVDNYNLECYGVEDPTIHIYKGYDWNGSIRFRKIVDGIDNYTFSENVSFLLNNGS